MKKQLLSLLFVVGAMLWSTQGYSQCSVLTGPYSQDFESQSGGSSSNADLPACWKYEKGVSNYSSYSTYLYVYNSSTLANSGSKSLRMYKSSYSLYSGDSVWAMSPKFDLSAGNYEVKFTARASSTSSSYDNSIYIGVTDSAGSTSAITIVDTVTSSSTSYAEFVVDLSSTAGVGTGDSRVVFMSVCNGSTGYLYMDDVKIRVKNSCDDITNLAAATTTTGVGLGWDGATSHSSYTVEYGLLGFTPGSGTTVTVTTDTAHITGLSPSTYYDFWVKGNCSTSSSGYASKATGFSPCAPLATPWNENFDAGSSGGSTNPSLPGCWDYYNNGSGTTTYPYAYVRNSSSYANSGSQFIYVYKSGSTSTSAAYADTMMMVGPEIQGLDSASKQVSFSARTYYSGYAGQIVVGVTDAAGTPSSLKVIDTVYAGSTTYDTYSLYLDAATGVSTGDSRLAFVFFKDFTYDYICIDDVSITNMPACPAPVALSLSSATRTSATITWSSPATVFDIEIGPTGFQQGTGSTGSSTTNSYTATGLAASTFYDVYVMSNCTAAGNGTTSWVGPLTFSTECGWYDEPWTETFGYSDGSGSSTNPDLPNCWSYYTNGSQYSYVAKQTSSWGYGNLTTDSSYLFLRAYQSQFSSTYNLGDTSMIILPLTNDLSSGDLQLLMNARGYSGAGVGSQTDNIIVGTIDSTGDVASMHIIDTVLMTSSYQDYTIDLVNTPTDAHSIFLLAIAGANGTYTYGYNESYIDRIDVRQAPQCPEVYDVVASVTSDTSATVDWGDSSVVSNYFVEWGPAGFVQATGATIDTVSTSEWTNTTLSPNTTYDIYIQSECSTLGVNSPWTGPITIMTPCSPQMKTFIDGFEGLAGTFGSSTDPNLPDCWVQDRGVAASYMRGMSNTYGPFAGSGYVEFWGMAQNSDTVILSSPAIENLDSEGAMVSFYAMANSASYLGKMQVGVSNFAGSMSSVRSASDITLTTSYQLFSIYLDSNVVESGDMRVAFIFPEGDGQWNDIRMDSVTIEDLPSCGTYAHTVSALTDSSADITWNYFGNDCFNIEYGLAGFIQGTGVGAQSGTLDTNITSNYTVGGLNPNTAYDFYVENCCNPGTWEGPFTFTTECTGPLAAGTYSVGPTGDFATLDSVMNTLNACGIAGAVTFELQTGTFSTGQSLGEVSGSSTTNTITFTGAAGASDTLVSISLDGASNIVLDDLFIYNMNSDAVVLNGTENVTITNNRIEVTTTSTSTLAGLPIVSRNGQYYYNGSTESNLTIAHNELIGGYFGIAMYGTSSNPSSNVHVAHNEFSGQYYYGAYLSYIDDLEFDNNVLSSFRSSSAYGARFYYANNVSAHENHVSGGNYGLYTYNLGGTHNELVNNMLDAGVSGIYNYFNDSINIYHNTSTGSYGIYSYYSSNSDVRNNIFVGTTYAVYERLGTDNHFDYNVYYSTGTYMGYTTTTIDSLGEWQSLDSTMNMSSVEDDPVFLGPGDLHVVGLAASDAGDNSLGVMHDIDGDVRPSLISSTVDIGADEYDVVYNDAALTSVVSPAGAVCGGDSVEVIVEVTNLGVSPITSTDITVTLAGQTLTGTYSVDTIGLGESDEVSVGYVSQFVGGMFTLDAEVDLQGDSRANNDMLTTTVEILDAQQVVPVAPDFACAGDVISLSIAHPSDGMLMWSNANGDTIAIVDADSTVSMTLTQDTTLTLSAVASQDTTGNVRGIGSAGGNYTFFNGPGVLFDVTQASIIDSVTLYPSGAGTTSIAIQDAGGTTVWSTSVSTTATGNTAEQVYLGANMQPGSYRMIAQSSTTGGLYREYGVTGYPFSTAGGEVSITQGTLTNYHYFFYNWIVTVGGCEREDSTITVQVHPDPVAAISVDTANATITATDWTANWSTSGTSGADSVYVEFSNGTTSSDTSGTVTFTANMAGESVTVIAFGPHVLLIQRRSHLM
jgi:hypothetical protein